MKRVTLGQALKTARNKRGLTQKQVATLLGVDQANVSGWETDSHLPRTCNLGAVADAYGIPLATLARLAQS